jgi:hypothetical protein
MDTSFCKHYVGTGSPPTNRFCRHCPDAQIACDKLWQLVVHLSNSKMGSPVFLPGTKAQMHPDPNNWNIVHLRINSQWNLGKEDFLYFIAPGSAQLGRKTQRLDPDVSPSMTRQVPYVQTIVKAIGGYQIPEILAVKKFQKGE